MEKNQKNKITDKELAQNKVDKVMDIVARKTAYYRANPHRFCEEYLGIKLKLFQKILIFMMNFSNYFMFLACRGLGKTFLTAIYCVVRCILYPGTKICIASGKRKQAIEVLEKITTILMPNSVYLQSEVKTVKINQSDAYIEFHNGSRIKVVTALDTARGNRANILICDEFRMVALSVIQTVLRKFLTAPRQPGYLNKEEYKHLSERNKEIYMSSCWYQSHWSYEKAKTYVAKLTDDKKKYFICALPYQLAIKENLLSREQVEDEMSESDFNSVSWMMEMECLFFGDNESGLYSYEEISQNRKIKYPCYPESEIRKLNDKKLKIQSKTPGEIRILSADIALMSSKVNRNDATSIFLNQAMPTGHNGRYINNITYTLNQEGLRTDEQALSIRKLIEEFDVDYLAIDAKGIGLGVIDALMADIYDPNTGVTYGAISCCNNKEIAERCKVAGAPKKIWAILGSSEFNSQCALGLREAFKQGKIRLLSSEFDFEDNMQDINGFNKLSNEEKEILKLPYIHTTLLINELVELEYEVKDKVIKVKEKSTKRKDRYSSLGYNIFVVNTLEREKRTINQKDTVQDLVLKFRAPMLNKKR